MKNKQDTTALPGYPLYPENQDITLGKNNNGKVLIESINNLAQADDDTDIDDDNNVNIVSGTDADIEPEELQELIAMEQSLSTFDAANLKRSSLDSTDNDGDPLNEDSMSDDLTGEDLDVPGSSADNADEQIGEEDEENNYYSLGGDNHESQEENKGE